jgi:hypothetical protein
MIGMVRMTQLISFKVINAWKLIGGCSPRGTGGPVGNDGRRDDTRSGRSLEWMERYMALVRISWMTQRSQIR